MCVCVCVFGVVGGGRGRERGGEKERERERSGGSNEFGRVLQQCITLMACYRESMEVQG